MRGLLAMRGLLVVFGLTAFTALTQKGAHHKCGTPHESISVSNTMLRLAHLARTNTPCKHGCMC